MKIAVIGCGYWGKNLARNLAQLGALAAVCDANLVHAREVGALHGVEGCSLEQILSSDAEGVMIAASASQHYMLTRKALLAGKHVFVEKPFTLKLSDAVDLYDLSLKYQRKLMVGHLLQYHPAFVALKRLVMRGELGHISYIAASRLNFGHFRYSENIWWDFAPHDVSMILALAGDLPTTVMANGVSQVALASHDIVNVNLGFMNGLQAQICVSRLHPFKEQKLIVVGDQGMAVFDDTQAWPEKLQLFPHKIDTVNGMPQANPATAINVALKQQEPLSLECQHFIDCIKNNAQPRTDAAEALAVVQVLHAAQQSLQTRDKVTLREDQKGKLHETAFG